MGLSLTAVVVEEHKVSTNESIDSIAQANGFSGQALAQFNWDTSDPQEINRSLVEIVGCTKKTKDGKNYILPRQDRLWWCEPIKARAPFALQSRPL